MSRTPDSSPAGRKVFLTGAASGIGRALATALAQEHAVLHLTDIDSVGLARAVEEIRAAGGRVDWAEPLDVADHDAVREAAARLTASHGAMDMVMNIAGIAVWGTVRALEHQHWRQVVDVNLMGPIHVIEELVPPMVESGRGGHVVNCSSAAGIIGMPWHAAYSASKFGLRGVSEVLRFDLARHGIQVHLVCPGGVDTGITETVRIAGVATTTPSFDRARERFRRRAVSPEDAATAILKGVGRGRYWVYTSGDIRAVHLLQRWCPPAYVAAMRLMNRVANRTLPEVERARRPDNADGAA